ncbi:MAG: DUF2569 domain-containing protein, partial [Terracidiphilus sp.]
PAEARPPGPAPSPTSFVPSFAAGKDLEGIGGWLILVAFGLGIAPFTSIRGISVDLRILYGASYQTWLSAHRGIAALILFEAATNSIFLLGLLGLNLLFYRKKKAFSGWMITYLATHLALILFDHLVALRFSSNPEASPLASVSIGAAIWIPYFLRSERVKTTFVH